MIYRLGFLTALLLLIPMVVVIASASSQSADDLDGDGSSAQTSEEISDDRGLSPCGSTLFVNWMRPYQTFEQIAWGSNQVVVGTVVSEHPTYGELLAPDLDETARQVVTDYEIQVEYLLRGEPAETVTVRRLGGHVDDCKVVISGQERSQFRAGDRFLLFLTEDGNTNYWAMGPEGIWRIAEDGTIQGTSEFLAIQSSPGTTYHEVATHILDSLRSEIPEEGLLPDQIVPLDDAPVPSDSELQLPES